MVIAWMGATFLLIYFWPHLVYNRFKRAIIDQGFGNGPVPINTLYTEPQRLFRDPLHTSLPPGSSNLMTVGVNHDTLLTVGWLDLSKGPEVLHVPDFAGRYYSVQFTDPFDVDFAYVGTRQRHATGRLRCHSAELARISAARNEADILAEQFGTHPRANTRPSEVDNCDSRSRPISARPQLVSAARGG